MVIHSEKHLGNEAKPISGRLLGSNNVQLDSTSHDCAQLAQAIVSKVFPKYKKNKDDLKKECVERSSSCSSDNNRQISTPTFEAIDREGVLKQNDKNKNVVNLVSEILNVQPMLKEDAGHQISKIKDDKKR